MHKIIISLFTFGLCISMSNAQVPAAVKEAFTKKFPKAQEVNWDEMEDEEENIQYEASFVLANKDMSSVFSSDGTWIQTATFLDKDSDMPDNVKSTIKNEFAGEISINQLRWIEKKTTSYYELVVTDEDDTAWIALITKEGKLLELN